MADNGDPKKTDPDRVTLAVLSAQVIVIEARIRALRSWRSWSMGMVLTGVGSIGCGLILSIVRGSAGGSWIAYLSVGGGLLVLGSLLAVKFIGSERSYLQQLSIEVASMHEHARRGEAGSKS